MSDTPNHLPDMKGGIGSLVVPDQNVSSQSKAPAGAPAQGTLVFRPWLVQSGRGPHLLDWAYATDMEWDSFYSNISVTKDGVVISDSNGRKRFGVNVRWNVEGFGYIFMTADNEGEGYELPPRARPPC